MNKEQFEAFAGKSKEYYLDYFDRYTSGKKAMFSISALVFGIFWFLYRKMYLQALVILMLLMIVSVVEEWVLRNIDILLVDVFEGISTLTSIIVAIIIGFYANYIYIKFASNRVRTIAKEYPNDEQKQMDEIRRRGGTSFVGIWVFVGIIVLIGIVYGSK